MSHPTRTPSRSPAITPPIPTGMMFEGWPAVSMAVIVATALMLPEAAVTVMVPGESEVSVVAPPFWTLSLPGPETVHETLAPPIAFPYASAIRAVSSMLVPQYIVADGG